MRSSSYGSLKLAASAVLAGATFLGLYACSSSSDTGSPTLPDGAIVDNDGPSNTDPDAIAAGDTATEAAPASLVNVTTNNLTVSDDPRHYVLSVPKTYNASKSYPLIVALHGDGENADGFRQSLGFDSITGNDAITAYPDQVLDLFTPYDQNGDQLLVAATIADVVSKYNIDQTKIWGFGYSKGGYMLNQLQCLHPGQFTAIAAHATGKPADVNGNLPACLTATTTAILEEQGDQDTVPESPGADEAALYWAQQNGCAMTTTTITPSACVRYDGCPAGKQVEYCLAPGVAHSPIWNQATTVSWAFYKSL